MSRPSLRVIRADALRAIIGFADLIEPVAEAFRQTSAGRAQNGQLTLFPGGGSQDGDVYVKAGAIPGQPTFIVKVSPWFAANTAAGIPQGGFVAILDARTGHTLALLEDEHYLSDIRTAAAGALAARLLAPPVVYTSAVIGAGVQAYWQAIALHRERPFKQLLVWGRTEAKAATLKERLSIALPDVRIDVEREIEQAVRKADVVITATLAREPIVRGAWLRPGQHVTAVGADDATKCELDSAVLNRARVFVDAREVAAENGDVLRAVSRGEYALDLLAGEIGDILLQKVEGRRHAKDITVAKLVGIGAQDLVAAQVAAAKLN